MVLNLNAQDIKSDKEILITYTTQLLLTGQQKKEFKKIYKKFENDLMNSTLDNTSFNSLLKQRDLEMFSLLNKDQFKAYKDLKKEIEPNLKYRTN